jgi:N-acetylmuramoyl-L-alanine amidase
MLKREIKRANPSVTVVCTRTTDRYLSLGERTRLANAVDANLFVSLHCNSAEEPGSFGLETYFLSTACSTRAMNVAARENQLSRTDMDDLQKTLMDLLVVSKRTQSAELAQHVHAAVWERVGDELGPGGDRGIRRAPFCVLIGAKMPAIIVECGFMSNERDRRKLADRRFLEKLARGMAQGIRVHLSGSSKTRTGPLVVSNR